MEMKLMNADIYRLNEKLAKKKLVCFGAGKLFKDYLDIYREFGFEKRIEFIMDNDIKKCDTKISVGDQNIRIISLRKFCMDYDTKNYMILITCADCVEIYEQLRQIEKLKDVECYIFQFVRALTNETDERNRFYPEDLRIYKEAVIPKVIHYCWFGHKKIPGQNREWMDSWAKYCPDYEIVEWNEENYDMKKNTYMYEAYKAEKWGFVSDYARLDIIYNHGGIYFDTDVEIIKNLDELLYQDAFAGVDGSRKISLGLGFGARRNLDLIRELRDGYNERSFYSGDGVMDLTAIPTLQIPFFEELGYVSNGEYQRVGNLTVYPEKVLAGKCCFTGNINPTENTFAIHHYDGSWNSKEKRRRAERQQALYKKLCDG